MNEWMNAGVVVWHFALLCCDELRLLVQRVAAATAA